jgi:Bacterial protein of unknown function (DUF922)
MKQTTSFIIIAIILISCNPKISFVISNKQTTLKAQDIVVVLQQEDNFTNDGIQVGTLRSSDNGFSIKCRYEDVIGTLADAARQNGANIIKITKHKVPDIWSSCDRITAAIYKVDNPQRFEKEIEWSADRKLTWEDFKGAPTAISDTNFAATTNCGFGFHSNRVTMFEKVEIFTRNIFNCNLSWVRPNQMDRADLLEHEQGHFDISEIYARQLRKELKEAGLNYFNLNNKATKIFSQVYSVYQAQQELYEKETNFGLDKKGQAEWNNKILAELLALDAYANVK